jgi:hypothetical protein
MVTSGWNYQWLAAQRSLPKQPALASFHHKIKHGPFPSPPAKVSKMRIRVNLLAHSLYSSIAEELKSICWSNDSELMKEWVTHLAKTTTTI